MPFPYTDNFNRANGSAVGSTMSDGQLAWTGPSAGSWVIDTNRVYCANNDGILTANFGVPGTNAAPLTLAATLTSGSSAPASQGICFRASDASNYFRVVEYYDVLYVQRMVAGTPDPDIATYAFGAVNGDTLTVIVYDTTIDILLNGASIATGLSIGSMNQSVTNHGLANTEGNTAYLFDAFSANGTAGGGGGAKKHYYASLNGQR